MNGHERAEAVDVAPAASIQSGRWMSYGSAAKTEPRACRILTGGRARDGWLGSRMLPCSSKDGRWASSTMLLSGQCSALQNHIFRVNVSGNSPEFLGRQAGCGADGALSVAQARYRHGGSCRGVCRSAGCPEHCLAANADPGAAAGGIAQATPLTRPYATFRFKTSLSCLAEVRDAWSAERSGGARHRPEAAATRFPTGGGGRSRHAESLPHHGRRGFLADARDTAAGNGRHNVEIALGTRWPAAVPHAPKGS